MKSCSILGHRKIEITPKLKNLIKQTLTKLIIENSVSVFLFGSKSAFNDLCYEIISELKTTFPNIQRIYVRAEYPQISSHYTAYLKTFYEKTYFHDKKLVTNSFSYIKRNEMLVDKSDICIFYYNPNYVLEKNTKSGTKIAYEYAIKKHKQIINLYL